MCPDAKVKFLSRRALLVMASPLLGMLLASSAQALSLTPMRIETSRGQLQISNSSDRSIQIQLQVYGPRLVDGFKTAAVDPLDEDTADNLIRLKRSVFRLGPGATRLVPYRIVSSTQPFYVCGTSLQGLFNVRVCSRWVVPPSSTPGRQKP
jgi:P pilus assembly chaperone PapD